MEMDSAVVGNRRTKLGSNFFFFFSKAEQRADRVAQPAEATEESEHGRNSEPVEQPRLPRRALLAVNALFNLLTRELAIV